MKIIPLRSSLAPWPGIPLNCTHILGDRHNPCRLLPRTFCHHSCCRPCTTSLLFLLQCTALISYRRPSFDCTSLLAAAAATATAAFLFWPRCARATKACFVSATICTKVHGVPAFGRMCTSYAHALQLQPPNCRKARWRVCDSLTVVMAALWSPGHSRPANRRQTHKVVAHKRITHACSSGWTAQRHTCSGASQVFRSRSGFSVQNLGEGSREVRVTMQSFTPNGVACTRPCAPWHVVRRRWGARRQQPPLLTAITLRPELLNEYRCRDGRQCRSRRGQGWCRRR